MVQCHSCLLYKWLSLLVYNGGSNTPTNDPNYLNYKFHIFANNNTGNPTYCCPNAYVQTQYAGGSSGAIVVRFSMNGLFMNTEEIATPELNSTVYPNPTGSVIKLSYILESPLEVEINIYDLAGKNIFLRQSPILSGNQTIRYQLIRIS